MTIEPTWWEAMQQSTGSLYSGDDDDPLMLRLAYVGRSFTDHIDELTEQQQAALLALMEHVVVHGSETDSTAVTTGFLEALISAWDRGFDLKSIWHHVGPESRTYCRAWNEFNGIPSPDWM
jgi:hypothetical protein